MVWGPLLLLLLLPKSLCVVGACPILSSSVRPRRGLWLTLALALVVVCFVFRWFVVVAVIAVVGGDAVDVGCVAVVLSCGSPRVPPRRGLGGGVVGVWVRPGLRLGVAAQSMPRLVVMPRERIFLKVVIRSFPA